MKKRIAIMIAAMLVVAAAAGCGNKTENKTTDTQNTTQTDASGAYENAGGGESAAGTEDFSPEQVDMDKVEGEEMISSTDKNSYKGKLGEVEVEIGEAKIIEYNGEEVAVVSFEYKNNSDTEMPFTGSLRVEATQDGNRLTPTVVTGVEGVTMMSMTENVAKGDKITVQMAYKLRDRNNPLVIEVNEFFQNENSSDGLTKVFGF